MAIEGVLIGRSAFGPGEAELEIRAPTSPRFRKRPPVFTPWFGWTDHDPRGIGSVRIAPTVVFDDHAEAGFRPL